jgi:chromosome segregation ATPase
MNHQSKLDQFAKRRQAIDSRMIELEQLRREFTVLAAKDDQAALQRIMKLDAEATNLRRELSLLSDAAAEIRHQQVQAAEAAAKQQREQREAEGRKLAVEVQSVNHQLDTTLIQLRQMFQRRAELIGALNNCKTMNAAYLSRLQSKFGSTAACRAAGLDKFLSLEHVPPEHVVPLVDSNKSLVPAATAPPNSKRFRLVNHANT